MAGALLLERVARGAERDVSSKSTPTDLVSEADLAAERAIRELLRERRPHDGFLGEEGGSEDGSSGLSWVVDPLDGTVNFLFGIPQWCVSVAVRDEHRTLAGAVYDPNRDELFTATRGGPRAARLPSGSGGLTRPSVDAAPARRARRISPRRWSRRALPTTRACAPRRRRCSRGSCRTCATSAASAAPRSTSRGRPRAATTPTSSAPSSRGTSQPARSSANARDWRCASCRCTRTCRGGSSWRRPRWRSRCWSSWPEP